MPTTVWRHYALLILLAVMYAVSGYAYNFHGLAPALGWRTALWAGTLVSLAPHSSIVTYLALVPAIAVATGRLGRRGIRSAAVMLVITLVLMVAMDTVVGPAAWRASRYASMSSTPAWPSTFVYDSTIVGPRTDTLGYLRAGVQLLRERPAALDEGLGRSWSQDHPRAVASEAAVHVPEFLLPFITMGVVLGAVSWIRRRVSFHTSGDELVARWFIGWVLAAFVWAVIISWSGRGGYNALHARNYWLPFRPYLPFLVLAALGWRASARDAGERETWSAPLPGANEHAVRA
ncbi:MAG: hypothetical protein ABJE47_08440 [bacterium]